MRIFKSTDYIDPELISLFLVGITAIAIFCLVAIGGGKRADAIIKSHTNDPMADKIVVVQPHQTIP